MSQVEKAKTQLEKCLHRKKEALNRFEQAKEKLRKRKATIDELRSEIEIVRSAMDDHKKEITEKWQVRIDKLDKDNLALKMEIEELEKVFSMHKRNIEQYQDMDKEIQFWKEKLPYLNTVSKYHGSGNLNLYKKKPNVDDFPLGGTLEERLKWLSAYGQYIKALNRQ